MVSLSGFELSSDEDEPSLQPENPDDIESNPMQPPMIGAPPVILPQQPAPAAAPFDLVLLCANRVGIPPPCYLQYKKQIDTCL